MNFFQPLKWKYFLHQVAWKQKNYFFGPKYENKLISTSTRLAATQLDR